MAIDYAKIAASRIRRPSQVTRPPRILVYARNKKGKTTFCTTPGKGKVLVLDPEGGTDALKRRDPDVWPLDSWQDVHDAYQFLKMGKHSYEWVALDGLTKISNMSLKFVMKTAEESDLNRRPDQVSQRDYGRSGEMMKSIIDNFHSLPLGLVFTAQERMIDVATLSEEDEEATESDVMFVPDLPKGTRSAVTAVADVIGRLYTVKGTFKVRGTDGKVIEKEGHQRRLWIGLHESYDTGYRSDYELPDMIKNPSVPKLVKLIEEGTKNNG